MRPRQEDRERLEQDLQRRAYQTLLRTLQRTHRFLRRFHRWADVIAFMRNGTSTDPRKDEVLRPIFEAHAQGRDPRWRVILMAIFWPGLESIHGQKRHWDPDPDERWQNVTWTFLQVLCRIDVTRRPDRLVQKVYNDTVHHLYDEYRRAWSRTSREVTADAEEIDALVGGVEGIDVTGIELRAVQAIEIRRLRAHLDAGRNRGRFPLAGRHAGLRSIRRRLRARDGLRLPGRQEAPPAGGGHHRSLRAEQR